MLDKIRRLGALKKIMEQVRLVKSNKIKVRSGKIRLGSLKK